MRKEAGQKNLSQGPEKQSCEAEAKFLPCCISRCHPLSSSPLHCLTFILGEYIARISYTPPPFPSRSFYPAFSLSISAAVFLQRRRLLRCLPPVLHSSHGLGLESRDVEVEEAKCAREKEEEEEDTEAQEGTSEEEKLPVRSLVRSRGERNTSGGILVAVGRRIGLVGPKSRSPQSWDNNTFGFCGSGDRRQRHNDTIHLVAGEFDMMVSKFCKLLGFEWKFALLRKTHFNPSDVRTTCPKKCTYSVACQTIYESLFHFSCCAAGKKIETD